MIDKVLFPGQQMDLFGVGMMVVGEFDWGAGRGAGVCLLVTWVVGAIGVVFTLRTVETAALPSGRLAVTLCGVGLSAPIHLIRLRAKRWGVLGG